MGTRALIGPSWWMNVFTIEWNRLCISESAESTWNCGFVLNFILILNLTKLNLTWHTNTLKNMFFGETLICLLCFEIVTVNLTSPRNLCNVTLKTQNAHSKTNAIPLSPNGVRKDPRVNNVQCSMLIAATVILFGCWF